MQDGLGFPIGLAIAGGSALFGALKGKKKPKVTREDAESAVRQVYLELLERDPFDPVDPGAEGYVTCLLEGWCDVDFVRTEVLKSPEFRNLQTRKAQAAFATPAQAGFVSTSGLLPSLPEGLDVGRIFPYALGAIVLLSLMRR